MSHEFRERHIAERIADTLIAACPEARPHEFICGCLTAIAAVSEQMEDNKLTAELMRLAAQHVEAGTAVTLETVQ